MDDRLKDTPRLIEHAFPLEQASLDSVHEKNVRHGHISTLHIWPARRPLAACRAALIATLLPDPGTPEARQQLCEKIGGKVVKKTERKKMPNGKIVEREKRETEGGILHWGRETENKETLEWFRQEIRKAYGGRAPKVLDPFAGGGAIPLEAMRLGCEATAVDINPVAWFILKCTLEYPQKLAGQTQRLPEFILQNKSFMLEFFRKAKGYSKTTADKALEILGKELEEGGQRTLDIFFKDESIDLEADLAWHVRAWGRWVLDNARKELARYYPVYADFEPLHLTPKDIRNGVAPKPYEKQPMQIVPFNVDGTPVIESLNEGLSSKYLENKANPRWVAKPTVAYLWARTVKCKNCRATIPLLKTRWLCKKENKRILLTMEPNSERTAVVFGIENNVPVKGANTAQRREHDKRLGMGTMSRSGAWCPCCQKPGQVIMTMEDIRLEGQAGRLGAVNTAVVVDGQKGKEYRLPTAQEILTAKEADKNIVDIFDLIPFGLPEEPIIENAKHDTWCVPYGIEQWKKLFTPRQLLALGIFVKWTRLVGKEMNRQKYPLNRAEAICAYMALSLDRLVSFNCVNVRWKLDAEAVVDAFARFALPILWDHAEAITIGSYAGAYALCNERISTALDTFDNGLALDLPPHIVRTSSTGLNVGENDIIITDPPYYDSIGYSVLMDFFYVWLRRTVNGLSPELDLAFRRPLSPKWDREDNDGELVDDANRHEGDKNRSKAVYEEGMRRTFQACAKALTPEGKMVVVFANKQPDAWETLVSAIICAGFTVDGSWPIQTEMGNRTRALSSAALASSVWIICKKRPETARPGWDNQVLEDMRRNIREKLREFWDAGIRGPDFVWAATGPALEAFSKHPMVKKANDPGQVMSVSEFLNQVRRIVVDFVVGRVLTGQEGTEEATADKLDEPTSYYLLHRHDFGLDEAPAGACILYAVSCGLSDKELADTWDIISFTKGKDAGADEDDNADASDDIDADSDEKSGSKVKLKTWVQRKGRSMGYDAPGGKPVPLIDRIHRIMHLWRAGELLKVEEYLDTNGLRRQELFKRLLQSLIELSPRGSEERSLLESISNHVQARGAVREGGPMLFRKEELGGSVVS